MASLLVQKYGGTSVGSLERIAHVACHIKNSLANSENKIIVVVSAMGSFTDELIQMGKALHPYPPKRELDMLLTAGERISSALLCISLHYLGVQAISLTGSQCGILTDAVHGNARIIKILGHRIRDELKNQQVIIIAGFQGMSQATKDITTLGRGGSDLSAVALAVALEAKTCQIYTDVPGVMTADPRVVPSAKVIHRLPWQVMSELALAGAGVVHHRAALTAQKFNLPFEILSSLNPTVEGTFVEGPIMESTQVIAITSKSNQSLLRLSLKSEKEAGQFLKEGLFWLAKNEQSPTVYRSWSDGKLAHIEIVLDQDFVQNFVEHQKASTLPDYKTLSGLSIISIVGVGLRQSPELSQQLLNLLSEMPKIFEIKDTSILISVNSNEEHEVLNKLHQTFFPA